MSRTMMHHGAKVLIATFQFKYLVLFSSEKSFTLSLACVDGSVTCKEEVS